MTPSEDHRSQPTALPVDADRPLTRRPASKAYLQSALWSRLSKKPLAIGLAFVVALQLLSPPAVFASWTANCTYDGYQNKFAGMGVYPAGLQGVQAKIEWFQTNGCRPVGGTSDWSWSLSWISIVGRTNVFDIYQGGFAWCPFVSPLNLSCPNNNGISYYFYEYGYGDGACGPGFSSGFIKALKGNAPQGSDPYGNVYKIEHNSATNRYVFSIDGVDQKHLDQSVPLTCWGGVTGTQIMNEMLDQGDQNAGTVSNPQSYSAIQYQNSSGGWQNISWTLGRACDANSNPAAWTCNVSSGTHNVFYEKDLRAP